MSYVSPYFNEYREVDEIVNRDGEKKVFDILDNHYTQLRKFTKGVCDDQFHLIVNGDAGMGKTEIVNWVVENNTSDNVNVFRLSGSVTPVRLFSRLQDYANKGDVFIVDDTDKILEDQESLEILKGALDTNQKNVSWSKYTNVLRNENKRTTFAYRGRMIIITNKFLANAPTETPTIQQQRVAPVLDRCVYFKAGVPNNDWKIWAIRLFASNYKSKYSDYTYSLDFFQNYPKGKQEEVINWIETNKERLTKLSFRTVQQIMDLKESEPEMWKEMATSFLI